MATSEGLVKEMVVISSLLHLGCGCKVSTFLFFCQIILQFFWLLFLITILCGELKLARRTKTIPKREEAEGLSER